MKLFSNLVNDEKENIQDIKYEPIDVKYINHIIELIKIAQKDVTTFELCLDLEMGDEFCVDSHSLGDIKILKATKNEFERLQILYSDLLIDHTITIPLKFILGAYLNMSLYVFKKEVENGEE